MGTKGEDADLLLSPSSELVFHFDRKESRFVTLRNRSSSRIAFKVKLSNGRVYRAWPELGILEVGAEAKVEVEREPSGHREETLLIMHCRVLSPTEQDPVAVWATTLVPTTRRRLKLKPSP